MSSSNTVDLKPIEDRVDLKPIEDSEVVMTSVFAELTTLRHTFEGFKHQVRLLSYHSETLTRVNVRVQGKAKG